MCNDFANHVDYVAAFSQTRIPVKWPDAISNLQPRDDIWPTDRAPVRPMTPPYLASRLHLACAVLICAPFTRRSTQRGGPEVFPGQNWRLKPTVRSKARPPSLSTQQLFAACSRSVLKRAKARRGEPGFSYRRVKVIELTIRLKTL
jgi:hypothetical protein